jgi:hypothetical protein
MFNGKGLYFIGVIKNGTKHYPKHWLIAYGRPDPYVRGASKTLHCIIKDRHDNDFNIKAVGWWESKTAQKDTAPPKLFVSSCMSSKAAAPWEKTRHVEEFGFVTKTVLNVPQTDVTSTYFMGAKAIDVHNHLRQEILGLEYAWAPQDWWIRMYQTVIGMMVVNSFQMSNYFRNEDTELMKFVNETAWMLCHKGERTGERKKRTKHHTEKEELEMVTDNPAAERLPHVVCNANDVEGITRYGQCHTCHQKAYSFCMECGVYFCGVVSGRSCGGNHPVMYRLEYRNKK